MSAEWQKLRLGEVISLQRGHDLPEQDRKPGKVPIYGSFGITGYHSVARAKGPGVTVGRSGASFGVISYSPIDYWPHNAALYVTDFKGNDEKFIYYFLKQFDFQKYNSGSAIPSLNRNFIYPIETSIPPLAEQKAIAHILGTLDDKIELNRRMNETLESMARALFKSWFVDFDPVRKKQAGQSTGLPAEIDALFPGEFELVKGPSVTEPVEVPKGWRVGKLPEAFEINPTRSLSKNMNAPYLEMSNMPTDRAREEGFVLRPFGSGMKFINGDTLIARITPCLENGKTCFVDFLKDGEVGWGSTEYIVLRSKPPLGLSMSYFLARDENFRVFAISNMTGTTGRQRVPAESLTGYEVIIPPAELCDKFEEFSSNIFKKLKATDKETGELTAIRDTLLPKLISGELRVKDAERFVG